jgi:16S rRNA (cytosine967-C5)-methyltransferase
MAFDLNPKISLTVSDMRESIIANLKKRFQLAGIKSYTSQVVDLVAEKYKSGKELYDVILADLPCTGSGTWSRTPEQLYFFNENKISNYAKVQKQIVSNVIPQLQTGGTFIYITCSVFKKENEEVAEFIEKKLNLRLVQKEIIQGYKKKADSMFVAVFNSRSA